MTQKGSIFTRRISYTIRNKLNISTGYVIQEIPKYFTLNLWLVNKYWLIKDWLHCKLQFGCISAKVSISTAKKKKKKFSLQVLGCHCITSSLDEEIVVRFVKFCRVSNTESLKDYLVQTQLSSTPVFTSVNIKVGLFL